MNKKIKTPLSNKKVVLLSILSPIVLIILIIAGFKIADIISDNMDQNKFTTLDSDMRSIYKNIVAVSNGSDDWKYSAVCSANHTGDWLTGDYDCVTTIYLEKVVSSIEDVNNIHEKYFSIINNSSSSGLTAGSGLALKDIFGSDFVPRAGATDFIYKDNTVSCAYSINLSTVDVWSSSTDLSSEPARLIAGIRCAGDARGLWYQPVLSTSSLKPEKFN